MAKVTKKVTRQMAVSFRKTKPMIVSVMPVCVLCAVSLSVLALTGCGGTSQQPEKVTFTQVNELLIDSQHPCKSALTSVANELIGDKTHYLQVVGLPIAELNGTNDEQSETDVMQMSTLPQGDGDKGNLMLSGLLEYNDRPSHVRFDAFLMEGSKVNQNKQSNNAATEKTDSEASNKVNEPNEADTLNERCVVSYQLDYHFDQPCIAIREEAFKKWNKVADVSEKTQYYVHKRKANRKAYLTNLSRNTQCLASVRDVQNIAISQ